MKIYLLTILILAFNLCAFGQDGDKDIVVADKTSNVFYPSDCAEIWNISRSNIIKFYAAKFARIHGYARASQCNGVTVSAPVEESDSSIPASELLIGDKKSKLFYPSNAEEVAKIPDSDIVRFFNYNFAVRSGFTKAQNYTVLDSDDEGNSGYSSGSNSGSSPARTVNVRGYTRRDGTYVRPHTRSAPSRRRP